jgi:hypothetical protein
MRISYGKLRVPLQRVVKRPDGDHDVLAGEEPDVHRHLRWYWRDHRFPRLAPWTRAAIERHNAARLEERLTIEQDLAVRRLLQRDQQLGAKTDIQESHDQPELRIGPTDGGSPGRRTCSSLTA